MTRSWQQIAASYQSLRRYPEEAAMLDRILTIIPNDPATKVGRTMIEFYWKADTRPLHQMIESILAENPGVISDNFLPTVGLFWRWRNVIPLRRSGPWWRWATISPTMYAGATVLLI